MSNSIEQPEKIKGNLYLLPIIVILSILPLIVKLHEYKAKLINKPWFYADDTVSDFFLYFKSLIFIIICTILIFIMIYQYYKYRKTFKFTTIFIPLVAYAILALISSILSKYSYFSFHGIYEQLESIFVILGYCLVTYYTYLVVNSEDQIRFIFKWWQYGIAILCLISFTQFLGIDFFASDIGKKFILPTKYWNQLDSIHFNFEKNTVYATLYNPNYVGFYAALVAPIFLIQSFFSKTLKERIIQLAFFFALLLAMFGSGSRNGFICIAISLIFILVIFRNYLFKNWKVLCIGILVIAIAFIATNAVTHNLFINRLKEITNIKSEVKPLSKILTNKDNVQITYNNNNLYIKMNKNALDSVPFILKDDSGNELKYHQDTTTKIFIIDDTRFANLPIKIQTLDKSYVFTVTIDNRDWTFTNYTKDGTYFYYNRFGKLDKIIKPESAVFTNYESIAGRGYIWSRTIPLLKDHIILGSGADTFSLAFPQQDYVGLYNNGFGDQVLTKPHSMYLQIGVQTGVVSLLCFLAFYLMYFISSIGLYFNHKFDTYMSQVGVGIFIGTIAYMISGIANDSTITVAPTFWVLIGLGISINHGIKKKKVLN
ncbi:O-antigen ligase family protein [Anaeromicropila herbilytica]|uniref:Polymerase n=1 Tax=Anaeromicropila herbilytica TaxID=2785025 RepID=A0A7R7EPC1_9FIRM|nr:O-antigen ligase family protein [Anaeromicropila herbilytica]BCN32225.1 polymerase [Anaeromicropila herbilytica]